MRNMNRRVATVFGSALVFAASTTLAQDTVRVRGTIEKVEGQTLMVKSRDGADLKVVLADNALIVGIVRASLSDIKRGSFVGVTGMPQADGSQKAVEVHIFPEALRGSGDGHRPWDLVPDSTMTNGNIEQQVASVDGQTVKLKYKDGEKNIAIVPQTLVVAFEKATAADLKAGEKIFIAAATKLPDGSYEAQRIAFGKDGLKPPM